MYEYDIATPGKVFEYFEKEILKLPAVMRITKLSRKTIYLKISKGTFPKSISIGNRRIGWKRDEIYVWFHSYMQNYLELMKLRKVMDLTGLTRNKITQLIKKDLFPKPTSDTLKYGKNLVWHEEKIYAWIRQKVNFIHKRTTFND